MDGLSEDSTLLSAVLVADFIDRVAERWLYSLITASTAWLYHFLTGNHDVWLTLGFVAWKHSAAAILLRFVGLNQLYLITVIAVVTCFFGYHILQRLLPGISSGRTGNPRPMLVPSRISHSRLLPKRHSFSYPYVAVGIPVDFTGNVDSTISFNGPSSSTWLPDLLRPKAWFSIDTADHLQRQSSLAGLRGKLNSYLESEVRGSMVIQLAPN
jgi:hypothetical protein